MPLRTRRLCGGAQGTAHLEPSGWPKTRLTPCRSPRCTCRCRRPQWSHPRSSERPLPSRCSRGGPRAFTKARPDPASPPTSLLRCHRKRGASVLMGSFKWDSNPSCPPSGQHVPSGEASQGRGDPGNQPWGFWWNEVMLTARDPDPWGPPSPVGDAVVTVVAQGVVFRALPGDGGLGAAANPTSKNNGLACLTRDLTQGDDEFWGNCVRKESVRPVVRPLPGAHQPPPTNETRCCPGPELHRKPGPTG